MQWAMPWRWLSMAASGVLTPQQGSPTPTACTQLPGDLMLLPRAWWHATLNAGESFGLGTQQGTDTHLRHLLSAEEARCDSRRCIRISSYLCLQPPNRPN
jgi:hypothetical protein